MSILKSFSWVFPFIFFGVGYYVPTFVVQRNVIDVPSIVGKSLREAAAVLSNKGLNLRLVRQEERTDLPDGYVLEQVPNPTRTIRPNQHVFVTVARRPASLHVPDLVGLSEVEVTAWAAKHDIALQLHSLPSSVSKGQCAAHVPAAKQTIGGQPLIVYISRGSDKRVVVPDLVGLSIGNARSALKAVHASVDVVHQQHIDHKCTSCTVHEQKPMAGSIVDLSQKLHVQLALQ